MTFSFLEVLRFGGTYCLHRRGSTPHICPPPYKPQTQSCRCQWRVRSVSRTVSVAWGRAFERSSQVTLQVRVDTRRNVYLLDVDVWELKCVHFGDWFWKHNLQIDSETVTSSTLLVYEYRNVTVFWCSNSVVCFRMLFRDLLHKKVGTGRSERIAQHQNAGRGKSETETCNHPVSQCRNNWWPWNPLGRVFFRHL